MKPLILVVDDNALNRKLACDLLQLEGYEVQQSEDADQVIESLKRGRLPDMILMDISLPGMDGLTLTRQLKADGRYAGIPIVAMTAFAMKGDDRKAIEAGCSGYITKPIDTRRLPAQVAEYLATGARERTRLKIMIVEDHRIDLKLAGDSARLSGHVVLSNTTAEQAIESLDDSHPDVVLLDLNLPGIDGLSFLRRIKGDPRTSQLPVVAITAYPDSFHRDELMAAGCVAYLVKPIAMRDLMHVLESVSAQF